MTLEEAQQKILDLQEINKVNETKISDFEIKQINFETEKEVSNKEIERLKNKNRELFDRLIIQDDNKNDNKNNNHQKKENKKAMSYNELIKKL